MTRSALLPLSSVAELQSHTNRVNALVSVGADFVVASASSDVTIKFWDVRQGLLLGTLTTNVGAQGGGHRARVNCLVSLANSMLVSGGSDASIIIWDTTDVRQVYRMAMWNAHLSEVLSLSCRSRAGPLVYSGGDDNVIKVRATGYWLC